MKNCECCKKEITLEQYSFSLLCGLCDTGNCKDVKYFHEFQEQHKDCISREKLEELL